jgi:hypothetical protein
MDAKDLSKEAPRSPKVRIHDYVILARAIDKCRAEIACQLAEYHYDCPLDQMLFSFKGVDGAAMKRIVESGASDEQIARWLDAHGAPKTRDEVRSWSDGLEAYSLYNNLEKRAYFVSECERLGLDPKRTTMFEWLEADDAASFAGVR